MWSLHVLQLLLKVQLHAGCSAVVLGAEVHSVILRSCQFAKSLRGDAIKQRPGSDKNAINSSPPIGALIRSQMEAEALNSTTAAANLRWWCRVMQVETDRVTQAARSCSAAQTK